MENYTQAVNSRYFDLVDEDISAIWEDIENTPESTDKEKWKQKLMRISEEYVFSSRFALIRLFGVRAGGCVFEQTETDILSVRAMTAEQLSKWEILLNEIAEHQADADPIYDKYLIAKALRDPESAEAMAKELIPEEIRGDANKMRTYRRESRKKAKVLLSREEAFHLGHMLGFSLQEMQWFLLRVFDLEDGIRYNSSDDLIEAYGFIIGSSQLHVNRLKKQYAELVEKCPNQAFLERREDWTQNVSESFYGLVQNWMRTPENCDADFLEWIKEQSVFLDRPSRSALTIYRNLSCYAYDLLSGNIDVPEEDRFLNCMNKVVGESIETAKTKELLFNGDEVSAKKCKLIAGEIMLENLNMSFSEQTDKAKAWHVILTQNDGTPTSTGSLNVSRTRVQDLLEGTIQVEKSDLIYLLWFVSNLFWLGDQATDPDRIFNRLADFTEAAEIMLDRAMLPPFYPPHILEQSMMLSIVASDEFGYDPAELYEELCSSLIIQRNSKNRTVNV